MATIDDGTGSGRKAGVTIANRVETFSVTRNSELLRTEEGDSYNIETPCITLTSTAKSGLLFVRNNEPEDLVITGFFNLFGNNSASGSRMLLHYEFNANSGTLVTTTSNTITPVNKRVGNPKTLDATALFGFEGATINTGLRAITSLSNFTGRNSLFVEVVLPQGNSVAISCTPFVGTTNQEILAAVDCYKKTDL